MRLNNEMRESIRKSLLTNKFQKEHDQLREMEFELADEVYKATYTEDEHKLIEQIPKEWIDESSEIRCTFGGERHRFTFRHTVVAGVRQDVYRKTPPFLNRWDGKAFPADHKLAKKNSKRMQLQKDLEERETQASCAARAMLFQYTTTEKLIEAWPEVAPFVPTPDKPMVTALALPVSQLNAMLGLKAVKKVG